MLWAALSLKLWIAQAGPPPSLSLQWIAPSACPPLESVESRIGKRVGTATAEVTELGSGYHLVVTVNEHVRVVDTRTCEEAADAAVLIIQLGLGAPAVPEPPPSTPPPGQKAAPAPSPPPPIASPRQLEAGLLGGASLAWFPQPIARVGATFALRRDPWLFALDLTSGLPVTFKGGPTSTSSATFSVPVEGQLEGCWQAHAGPATFGPCLAIALGWMRGRGNNVSGPKTSSVVGVFGGLGGRAHLALTDWLDLWFEAFARTGSRPSLFFEGSLPLIEANWLSVDLSAGFGVRF